MIISEHKTFGGVSMEKIKEWFENSIWNWVNAINCRFVQYNDNIDRLAFFEELNYGWYQMYIYPYDDWYYPTISAQRKLLLNEDIPTVYVSEEAYDAIVYVINNQNQHND